MGPAPADPGGPDPHAVQPERPTVATHAHTVAPGWIEVESGMERDRFAAGPRSLMASLEAKIGLARRAQLSLFSNWQHITAAGTTSSGPGDVTVGIKWRLADEAPVLGDFAAMPALKLPTGSTARGTGTETTDASLLLISSHDLGAFSIDVNAGYTQRSGDGSLAPRHATLWTVSSGLTVVGWLSGVAEVYGFPDTRGPSGSGPTVAVLAGPTASPRPWLECSFLSVCRL